MRQTIITLILLLVTHMQRAWAESQFSADLELENRYFPQQGAYGNPDQSEISLRLQFDYSYSWDNSRKLIRLIPYALVSDPDDEKSHLDLREASFSGSFREFEVLFGIGKVFWGVAESSHLVDVINQTDLVENIDGEDKLGQPMISLGLKTELGTFTGFVLPYFRERSFPGAQGRLRTPIIVDTNHPVYESSHEKNHIDLALRWEHSTSYFDIGLHYFDGTSRDPILMPGTNDNGESVLIPHYQLITQTGLDVQITYNALLLKHESVYRNYDSGAYKDFYAQASGLEYTFYSVLESQADLGFILEYLSADEENNSLTSFDNHLFTAVRLTFNDRQDTSILAGIFFDHESATRFVNLEADRRLSPRLAGSLEIRKFMIDEADISALSSFERESYAQVRFTYSFD